MTALTHRIVELAKRRIPPRVIARQLGITPDTVYSRIRRARTEGADIPLYGPHRASKCEAPVGPNPHLSVPSRLHGLLLSYAERRGLTPSEAAGRILESALLKEWSQSDA